MTKERTLRSYFQAVSGDKFSAPQVNAGYIKTSQQVVISEGHNYRMLGRSVGNIGGPFKSSKTEYVVNSSEIKLSEAPGSNYERYAIGTPITPGGFRSAVLAGDLTAQQIQDGVPGATDAQMDIVGTRMVRACIPTNPLVDGSTALAELISRRPSVPGSTIRKDGLNSSSAAGEYLNFEFGVSPTVRDTAAIVSISQRADKILEQLQRDSGRLIRREFELPPPKVVTSTVSTQTGQYLQLAPSHVPSIYLQEPGTLTETLSTEHRRWFSGAFMYHLPKEGLARYFQERDHLYGLVPDLNTVYNVIPFSWAVDWFSNLGDVVSNISAFAQDGLVMPYGYVMWETTTTRTWTLTNRVRINGTMTSYTTSCSARSVQKRRKPANPFGFGLTDEGLSTRQKAILIALGLNRR